MRCGSSCKKLSFKTINYEHYSGRVLYAANKMHVSGRMPPNENMERTKCVPVLRYDYLFPA